MLPYLPTGTLVSYQLPDKVAYPVMVLPSELTQTELPLSKVKV